jgi:hypothetical protein
MAAWTLVVASGTDYNGGGELNNNHGADQGATLGEEETPTMAALEYAWDSTLSRLSIKL